MIQGFRDFILRGNIVDLAVAVIIGAAFNAVVDSLVKDIITPIIGLIGGQPDFSSLRLFANAQGQGGITYGNFLNAVIGFLIKAAAVYFIVVVPYQRLSAMFAKPAEPAAVVVPEDVRLLAEIRDLLAKQAK
jgi:large conductance mechanosensitive channel